MNVTAETSGQSPCARTTSSAPRPLSVVITRRVREPPSSDCCVPRGPCAFVATIAEVERPELVGVRRGGHPRRDVAAARHAQAVPVQCVGVLLAAREDGDVHDLGEMPRVEAPDHPAADRRRHARSPGDGGRLALGARNARRSRRGEQLLVLDRHPVRRAAGVDGDPDLGDARAELAASPRSARRSRRACPTQT